MSIFGALNTAVSGLRAQSYALENISGNIANSQTIGFKRTDSRFEELVSDASPKRQVSGSVTASSSSTNTVQGNIQSADISTYMAINGQGFFVVQKPQGSADGKPLFDGASFYTRRGDFQVDSGGYLVNGAGYYLMGTTVDALTGNTSGSAPQTLQFRKQFLAATATSEISYHANLAALPKTNDYDPAVAGSELIDPANYSVSPLGTGTVAADDVTAFLKESISGGAITVYDQVGSPIDVQFRWAKIDSTKTGGTDTWNLFYQTDANATGTDPAWQNVGTDYEFGADGKLDPPIPSIDLTNVSVGGVNLGTLKLVHGDSLTQFADPNGTAQVNTLDQNGYPAGELNSIAVSDRGRIVGTYTNGKTVELAEITLADFNNANGLKHLDGGAYAATDESGVAILGANGTISGSSVESSNTDIADEFSKLIVTQQAYSANARILTIAQEMSDETMNMLR